MRERHACRLKMAVRALEMDEAVFLSMWPEMLSGPEAVFIL